MIHNYLLTGWRKDSRTLVMLIEPPIQKQVKVNRRRTSPPIDFLLTSHINGTSFGEFSSTGNVEDGEENGVESPLNCEGSGKFRRRFGESVNEITINWAFHRSEAPDIIKSNLTFWLDYQLQGSESIFRIIHGGILTKDCQLHLHMKESFISDKDIPESKDCEVWFPNKGNHGLIIELTRLNIPCSKGYIHFSGLNISQSQHFKSHKESHLCGKLEELSEVDRRIYFPASHTPPLMKLMNNPVFSLSYHLVDYCYNITFVARNGSFELKPAGELMCTFKIYLPYGNRVALTLNIGDSNVTGKSTTSSFRELPPEENKCDGLETLLYDGDNQWSDCTRPGDAERQIEIVSRGSRVTLQVTVRSVGSGAISLRMAYRAKPIDEIVGLCEFGWVALRQFCLSVMEGVKLPWAQAEMECVRRGGHLASIRSEHVQNTLDNLLLNSPEYRDDNAYWIGASDKTYEGDFRWSDGLPFSYSNWFPGWSQHGHYNRQPNDDGLSDQDCVEVRRIYSLPTSLTGMANNFMWNDRDCSTPNYFICEKLQNDEPLEDTWPLDCNKTISLTRQHPRALTSSPGFPRQYPDNVDCNTYILAPAGYQILLDFEELVLENEPTCSYDYLEIIETGIDSSQPSGPKNRSLARRLCGDWSAKLKLLRYVSSTSKLILKFSSDYSHHFGGYKARVSMENAVQCADDRHQIFNNSCYLFVSYPEVTWTTAQHICSGIKSNLASILSSDEERFLITNLRKTPEYRTSALYWLGGRLNKTLGFHWIDNNPVKYLGWLPGQKPLENLKKGNESSKCLAVQWTPSPTPMLPSGLYWKSKRCNSVGGYVCKRANIEAGELLDFNKTINGTGGILVSPNFPENYYNNLEFTIKIIGPKRTRLVIKFDRIDIESQMECLYDYLELRTFEKYRDQLNDAVKICGSHDIDMHRFDYVSETNEAFLRFHSDYSISGTGYSMTWNAVDVSFCPVQTLTAIEGFITSPNYPDFLLPQLNCTLIIQAPYGQKVWVDFLKIDFGDRKTKEGKNIEQPFLETKLAEDLEYFHPFSISNLLTDGSFLSYGETFIIRLQTGKKTDGIGFKAHYKMINVVQEQRTIFLHENTSGSLLHLNYPNNPKLNVDFMQHFIAPLGSIISLELYNLKLSNTNCFVENGLVEIYDNYADSNGTMWKLCYDPAVPNSIMPVNKISSVLNTLHLRQVSGGDVGMPLNGSLKTELDENFKTTLLKFKNQVESCDPNPCRHGGKCITKGKRRYCECVEHFTGMFCALTKCDLDPCVFGTCELTAKSYKCHCKEGYSGPTCEQKKKPCEGNPCESRGFCVEKGEGFICRCHAWWEGPRCQKRMLHIPYKPLSERMFHEPFWLGLMTVFVVMAAIGLVWCAKRHFPEKIEKLLAEEQERSRGALSLRNSSVREQLTAASAASAQNSVSIAPSPGPGASRSLFGRLGIRKPSILSLTSPHASSGYSPATARTFSLDDLLKPLPRRSPSPKKKRNNSTPTKKNAAEKKQILQQLVSPNTNQLSRKVSLGELMQMSDRNPGCSGIDKHKENQLSVKETKFIENDTTQAVLTDPKLEKKVHFARLLNKVSAEMSSGSEMELGIMNSNKLGCAIMRPSSSPPSPCIDARSPNSTSSNQGSDSFSSDLALPNALSSSISDLLVRRHCAKFSNGKPASADSILAMFRNFSSSSAGANLPSSLKVSPSTTPTASSPQDDIAGDDESSSSSIHTPVSFSSGAPESPVLHMHNPQSTIEISVLDTLSAHKSSISGSNLLHPPTILLELPSTINKCLSPIREMPTPLPSPIPSPALTPIMRRSAGNSSLDYNDLSDDRISVELPNISISCSDLDDDDLHCTSDNIDLEAEDGLIAEEVAAMQQNMYKTKVRLPPLGQTFDCRHSQGCPPPLVIPTLTVEVPSPTFIQSPSTSFPGSPPPHKKSKTENCFQFPPPLKQRKMFKEFEKPTSLDLPCGPPMITITCNMSEAESDAESISPAVKNAAHLGASTSGMSYLSPFSMGNRNEQHASESNLSSSGYSSMASPGPSRCGSSNPLCPSEMEDQGPPGSGHSHRRPSPILKPNVHSSESERTNMNKNIDEVQERRGRSDSETLSDDPLIESNDEGIGTDHLEEKIEEGEVKSAKDLEMLINSESSNNIQTVIDLSNIIIPSTKCKNLEDSVERLLLPPPSCSPKNLLQLPSIVVQCDEGHLSPVSSRSESPLSDRTSRFSPEFYGKHRDLLPFTDSDGLYDFPSSGNSTSSTIVPLKKLSSKKREKKVTRNCKTPSPTKSIHSPSSLLYHLDIPSKDLYKLPPPRKLSPKRRVARSQVISSSSSSDSVTSSKEIRLSSLSLSPDTIRWSPSTEWNDYKKTKCPTLEDSPDEASEAMLPKSRNFNTNQKLSRLKAIGHQIRFLRRLETSLKHRERSVSPPDSPDSNEEDSPRATSPLLQRRGPKQEIRKSSSIGKLPSSSSQGTSRTRRGKYKRGDMLIPQHESWKRVVITGSGHSD